MKNFIFTNMKLFVSQAQNFHFHKHETLSFTTQSSYNIILINKNNIIFTRMKSFIFTNMKLFVSQT